MTTTRVLVLVIGLTAVLALAGPAGAAQLTLRDARGDVWRHDDARAAHRAPRTRLGDVTRATVRHEGQRVVVTIRLVALARVGRYANYSIALQSRRHQTREVVVEASPRSWRGKARVFRRDGTLVSSCHVRHHIGYRANLVRVVVPRTCLRRPFAVRANINVYRAAANDDFLSDNPQNRRDEARGWTRWVRSWQIEQRRR